MSEPIFLVTGIQGSDRPLIPRCWGYFHSWERAVEVVEQNKGDLYEAGYYPFIVIEQAPEGIYALGHNPTGVWWFQWVEDCGHPTATSTMYGKGGYVRCSVPERYQRFTSFGMG